MLKKGDRIIITDLNNADAYLSDRCLHKEFIVSTMGNTLVGMREPEDNPNTNRYVFILDGLEYEIINDAKVWKPI